VVPDVPGAGAAPDGLLLRRAPRHGPPARATGPRARRHGVEAERLSDRLCILNAGHVVAQGTLEELAGEPEIIVETSAPVPVSRLAAIVGGPVVAEGPTVLRCAVAPSPLRMAAITDFLASEGVALVSLRTRASLEERYLELIASDRSRSPS
jgi:ABC-type multidrug transport system ATPase subunit